MTDLAFRRRAARHVPPMITLLASRSGRLTYRTKKNPANRAYRSGAQRWMIVNISVSRAISRCQACLCQYRFLRDLVNYDVGTAAAEAADTTLIPLTNSMPEDGSRAAVQVCSCERVGTLRVHPHPRPRARTDMDGNRGSRLPRSVPCRKHRRLAFWG